MISIEHKHFFHRAGFGVGLDELLITGQHPLPQVIDEWIHASIQPIEVSEVGPGSPLGTQNFLAKHAEPRMQAIETMASQLDNARLRWHKSMSNESICLREKMTLFWHGHFACQCTLESTAQQYLDTIRKHALGNFRELLHAVAKTPAMILFLNNQQNRKGLPNENFARELMELFTLGRGKYTEQDVREAARAFTGWSTDSEGNFYFRSNNHDFGEKSIFGKQGRFKGEDILELILDRPETATYIAGKIYRYFVSEVIDAEMVDQLAKQLVSNNYELAPMMHLLFTDHRFYAKANIGTRIKSPIELLAQLSRLFEMQFDVASDLTFLQRAMGQVLFDPPNVAGWKGGLDWINNSTLMLRLNLAKYLLHNERFDIAIVTPLEAMSASPVVQRISISKDLSRLLGVFSGTPYQNLEKVIKQTLLSVEMPTPLASRRESKALDFGQRLILRTVSSPEFQMS